MSLEKDPRVVDMDSQKVIVGSTWNSGGEVYHVDPDCINVGNMHSPRKVSKDVAEWKNYTLCKECNR